MYVYIYRHAFQGGVQPCRGQRTFCAQSRSLRWEVPNWAFHSSAWEEPNFYRHSQSLTVPKKLLRSFCKFQRNNFAQKQCCLWCRMLGHSAL